jgi:hypothetical protein
MMTFCTGFERRDYGNHILKSCRTIVVAWETHAAEEFCYHRKRRHLTSGLGPRNDLTGARPFPFPLPTPRPAADQGLFNHLGLSRHRDLNRMSAEILTLMRRLRPHTVRLADSFALLDYLLDSALGTSYGGVYEGLFIG